VGEEPLTPAEAEKILSEDPPHMQTGEDAIRYVEAWMVKVGASAQRAKAVTDRLRAERRPRRIE
jgi:hypothetical protein